MATLTLSDNAGIQAQLDFFFGEPSSVDQSRIDSALRHFAEEGNEDVIWFLLRNGYNGMVANPLSDPDNEGLNAIEITKQNIRIAQNLNDVDTVKKLKKCLELLNDACKKEDHNHKNDDDMPPSSGPSSSKNISSLGSTSLHAVR